MARTRRRRWLTRVRELFPTDLGRSDGMQSRERRYFCRTCGTTLESHTSCPACGSYMVEAAHTATVSND